MRLTRVGGRKDPVWRVVVADRRSPRDGRFIETVGRYNAQTEPSEIVLNEERLNHWLARGAQPTNTVRKLMRSQGYGEGYDYDHDVPEAFSGQDYFPEQLGRQQFYDPPERGFEREIRKRLEYWAKLRKARNEP